MAYQSSIIIKSLIGDMLFKLFSLFFYQNLAGFSLDSNSSFLLILTFLLKSFDLTILYLWSFLMISLYPLFLCSLYPTVSSEVISIGYVPFSKYSYTVFSCLLSIYWLIFSHVFFLTFWLEFLFLFVIIFFIFE